MRLPQNYIFYSEDDHGVKTIQALKSCVEPSKTKEYQHLQAILDFSSYADGGPVRVGYISAKSWNEENKKIKFAY